jgi:capsular exopolysaccharide synthesis family protein
MDMMEEHHNQQLVQRVVPVETSAVEADSSPDLIAPVIRRWRVVLIVSLVICAIGIPAVWFLIRPAYAVTAAIRVAPIIPSILFSDKDSEGVIPMYTNFMNTQADLIMSDQVLQRVADDLVDKKLDFFENTVGPVVKLRKALIEEEITVVPGRNSELIKITMKSQDSAEAVRIVDAFVKAYMAIEASKETKGGDHKLGILESERKVLADKLQRQRQTIRQMAEEYGTVILTGRQEMMMQRVTDLQSELTKIQTRRITLEVQRQLLEETSQQGGEPAQLLKMRYEFINANPTIQVLSNNITQLYQGLIVAKLTFTPTNPELQHKTDLLDAMKTRLEEKRDELGKTFDDMMVKEIAMDREGQLANVKIELTRIADYEERLQDMLAMENSETIGLGRKHLAIQDQQEQLELTKELYDTVRRRIQQLEMERKRPARISVAYNASVAPVANKRIKFTAALIFGSLAAGMFLALLMGKADHSLYTPDDITKRVGVRIIGTTTNTDDLDAPRLPEQISCDYQTICANLGLLNGNEILNKLVITSAGMRDGKTTFAINLATSLAKADKKVLLIDGDLRKPDIRHLLDLPKNPRGFNKGLFSRRPEKYIHSIESIGLDILTTDKRNMSDTFKLLSLPHVREFLSTAGAKYDHVIIDTPPVLAFPDALMFAKIADGVILTSFAGRTDGHDLKETLDRLAQVNVKVLGTVLNNVSSNYGYNRYAYSYNTSQAASGKNRRGNKTLLLIKEFHKDHKDLKS